MSIFVEKKKNWLQKLFKGRKDDAILAIVLFFILIFVSGFIGISLYKAGSFDEDVRNFDPIKNATIEEIESNDYTLVADSEKGVFSYYKDGEKIPLIKGCYSEKFSEYKANDCISTDDPNVRIHFHHGRYSLYGIDLYIPESPHKLEYYFGTKEDGKFYAIPKNYDFVDKNGIISKSS